MAAEPILSLFSLKASKKTNFSGETASGAPQNLQQLPHGEPDDVVDIALYALDDEFALFLHGVGAGLVEHVDLAQVAAS